MSTNPQAAVLEALAGRESANVEALLKLMGMPSVSTDDAFAPEVKKTCSWLRDYLAELGFSGGHIFERESRHPILAAESEPKDCGKKTVAFYGHYDVQPGGDDAKWPTAGAFKPEIVDGKIVGRGAVDDKGQVMLFLAAIRAFKEAGVPLPVRVVVILEGEEECGSEHITSLLKERSLGANYGKADALLVCDTEMANANTPMITNGLRGLVQGELTVNGAPKELHSGSYGGLATNPLVQLAHIIASSVTPTGEVLVPGLRDEDVQLPLAEREALAASSPSLAEFAAEVGAKMLIEREGRSPLERTIALCSCDPNGIIGGYTGKGGKTAIPTDVLLKFSFRLPPEVSSEEARSAIEVHFKGLVPEEVDVHLDIGHALPGLRVSPENPMLQRAASVLSDIFGNECVIAGNGGSIPILPTLAADFGATPLLIGFGLPEDGMHQVGESFALDRFHLGSRTMVQLLFALALD